MANEVPVSRCFLRVVYSNSFQKRAEFPLQGSMVVIGSDPKQSNIVLKDIKVSATHAVIVQEGESFSLYDKDSVSGTFVNGEALTRGYALMPGDEIKVGDSVFSFTKRGVWGGGGEGGARAVLLDIGVGGAVLAVLALVLQHLPPSPEPERITFSDSGDESEKIFGSKKGGLVAWDAHSFRAGLPPAPAKAKMHFERGLKAYHEKTLDLSNAFAAILEMRRAKAYAYGIANSEERPFDSEEADRIILECRQYLRFQKEKYLDAYFKALGIGDYGKARYCMLRMKALFSDKFSDAKTEEYQQAEHELRRL